MIGVTSRGIELRLRPHPDLRERDEAVKLVVSIPNYYIEMTLRFPAIPEIF